MPVVGNFRKIEDVFRNFEYLCGERIQAVCLEPDIRGRASLSVRGGVCAGLAVGVAVCIHGAGSRVCGGDGSDAQLRKGMQFASGGYAISVGILPDLQIAKSSIRGVNLAIFVASRSAKARNPLAAF